MSYFPPRRPYPDARYTGEHAEVSAWRRPDDSPTDLDTSAISYDYLATGEQTAGDFGLYRLTFGGAAAGPGPHFHRTMSESFYVLSGTIRLFDGDTWIDGRPGDFLHVPAGGNHGFRNESGTVATMLLLFAPGAPREQYFEGLAHLATADPRPSDTELEQFFVEHDNLRP